MCKLASFLWHDGAVIEVAVADLQAHSDTQRITGKTEAMGWFEGHYTPEGELECRKPGGRAKDAEAVLLQRWPRFVDFFSWAIKQEGVTIGGGLSLNGLTSAQGLVLPKTIGGWLYLNGLTSAQGLVLPKTIGGGLSLNGLTSEERERVITAWKAKKTSVKK